MAICKEKLVNYLEGIGYNLVRLPRTNIQNLDIIIKNENSYENLGSLSRVWSSSQTVPQPKTDGTAANIQQKQTSLIDVSVGLKALEGIFSGMGFAVPELNLAFSNVKKMTIKFNNVTVSTIAPFEIGAYLKSTDSSKLDVDNPFVKYFLDDECPIYIISEIIKSNSITIDAYLDSKTSGSLDIGILQNAIKSSPKVSFEKESDSSITYEGNEQLVFGFKCYQIGYFESGWGIEGMGDGVFLSIGSHSAVPKTVKLEEFRKVDIKDKM
ncbi:gasdermin [Spirosoma foliorum]|uniref:Gasdermin bGSDM n=1 Tax=Spirosoma foliorum TaxID=2710596 RepID=A0A7G5GRK1_9BACT|nr:hypothetical protein [Spirosoma foliorum]QMW01493.1 hypothetical protein H3H32_26555 [Spirosoma foliorum]